MEAGRGAQCCWFIPHPWAVLRGNRGVLQRHRPRGVAPVSPHPAAALQRMARGTGNGLKVAVLF